MHETAGCRTAASVRCVSCSTRAALAAVDARLHPVELVEDVVGQVERAVGQDVALRAAQDPERRDDLVGGGDLLRLPAERGRVEAVHGADGRRVVADRQVLVAAVARRLRHLEHRRLAVRPGRMAVEVAAHVRQLDELRRLVAERQLAQLGRQPGDAQQPVDARLVGRLRQRLERLDVRRRRRWRGRARCRTAACGAATSSTGTPSTVTPTARRPSRPITATICGSAAKRSKSSSGRSVATTTASRSDRSRKRRGSPAATPPSAVAIALDERPAPRQHEPASRARRGRLEREPAASPRSSARRRGRAAARRRRSRRGSRRRSRRRVPAQGRPTACAERPSSRPKPDDLGQHLALELAQLGDLAGLDELAQARLDRRADPAQLARRGRRARARRRERASRGSGRPPAGRRGRCTSRRPRGRAAPPSPRAARRSPRSREPARR